MITKQELQDRVKNSKQIKKNNSKMLSKTLRIDLIEKKVLSNAESGYVYINFHIKDFINYDYDSIAYENTDLYEYCKEILKQQFPDTNISIDPFNSLCYISWDN